MSTTTTIELAPAPTTQVESRRNLQVQQDVESLPPNTKVRDKGTTAAIITAITGVTMISSLLIGLVTIGLPVIAKDLKFPEALLIWPASIFPLTCGCTLILSGTIADVVGSRTMYLLGTLLQSVLTLACALSKTSFQMILFRGLAGIAMAMCLPSAVSLITTYFDTGRRRNLAFGLMGGGQPLGFAIGLVVGGVLVDAVDWQLGFYLAAGVNVVLFLLALFTLPRLKSSAKISWSRLRSEVDWVGAFMLSSALALLLYVFASWTGDIAKIKSAESLSCLTIGVCLLPTFVFWVHRQEALGRAALIRNSLWRNKVFTSICINVFFIWGSFNATETFLTFFFQDGQGLKATSASVRFLPEPVIGAVTNILIGLYIHRLNANWALTVAFILSAVAPLLLAVMRPDATYWAFVFPAVTLIAMGVDTLYTVSQLVITAEFDDRTQALAGGVFNTVAQIGKSVGLAMSALIASSVSNKLSASTTPKDRLFEGYRAAWWSTLGMIVLCILVTLVSLRNIGKVGLKRD